MKAFFSELSSGLRARILSISHRLAARGWTEGRDDDDDDWEDSIAGPALSFISDSSAKPAGAVEAPAVAAAKRIVLTVQTMRGFSERARGLIGREKPTYSHGIVFPKTASVHGFGMRYAIDVVFLDRQQRVLRVCSLRPWRARFCIRAHSVVEMRAGEADRLGIGAGTALRFIEWTAGRSGQVRKPAECPRTLH